VLRRRARRPIVVALVALPCLLVACGGDDDSDSEGDLSDEDLQLVAQALCPDLEMLVRHFVPNADSEPDAREALSYTESRMKDLSCEGVLVSTTTTSAPVTVTIDDDDVASVVLDMTRADCDELRHIEGVARASFAAVDEGGPEDIQFADFLNTINAAIAERGC
jgi:hypothetical protein